MEKDIESRMKKVLENLEYLAAQKDVLRLEEGGGGAGWRSEYNRYLTTSLVVDEAGTYGRDDDKDMIIEWLLSDSDNSQPSIISIVGMGGLGKSTLAQLVYNDQRLMNEFDIKAWVCVSDDFDVLRVTKTILKEIGMSNDDSNNLNMLQIKLKQVLTHKRFFLVLDDVWNENYILWEALQSPFNHGAPGSKILVTTRSEIVVSTIHSAKVLSLKPLSDRHSWCIFSRYAFCNGDIPHSNFDLEKIGRNIIKKCKGLPLALKAIGSLLYTKLSNEHWNGILKSEIWEEKSNILPALRLSYHYLPSRLKRCFAYCSLFPKDYEFDKEHLIQLWMAENFLQCGCQSKDPMVIGEQFFHDLLSRSLFQRSTRDKTCFVMHDLINDLAKEEIGKFCHRLEVDKANNMTKKTRHVSYLKTTYETSKRFEVIYQANRLRTFLPLSMKNEIHTIYTWFCMSSKIVQDVLSKFRCVRVLSLSDYYNIVELPDSIGNLKHLRYLDLSGTGVKDLPDSICQLYHLQTLKLWCCRFLEKLPTDLHTLENLRHLDFRETMVTEMPKQLGQLKNLQVLSSFIMGKCKETSIKELKELNLSGKVSILELQNVVDPGDASEVNLKNKIDLEELSFAWSMNKYTLPNDIDVLEKLQPHLNLKRLSIINYGGNEFPHWLANRSLSNLVSLELRNCKYCLSLPSLDLLPSLKSLSIIGFESIVTIGPEFIGNSSVTTVLEILRFEDMERWEEWKCENMSDAFPHLQEFYIEKCPKLKEHLPPQLPSLRKLVIKYCEKLVASVPWTLSLHKLVLRDCSPMQLEYLPSTLKVLHISGCFPESFSVEKIENTIAKSSLMELKLLRCAHLELPLKCCHSFLLEMRIEESCYSLKSFPLYLFPKLQLLELIGCSNLEMITVSGAHHPSLIDLRILKCSKFVSFPQGGFTAPKLESCFIVELENLKSLPERMYILFPSLTSLEIVRCPQVESFPDGGLPSNLKSLYIVECPKLIASQTKWDLHSHTSLQYLCIDGVDDESLPEAALLPPTLDSLCIMCCSNLRRLEHKGLCHLSSLTSLCLWNCPELKYLPKEGLPSSLTTLEIVGCPMLKKRCQKQKGKDWTKISHIPCVRIDHDIIT